MEQIMFLLSYFSKNEYKSSKRTVDYRPCPECSSVHTPISSSFFLHLDLLINYSTITIICSTFVLSFSLGLALLQYIYYPGQRLESPFLGNHLLSWKEIVSLSRWGIVGEEMRVWCEEISPVQGQ